MPSSVIAVSYQVLRDIDFTSSKNKKRKLDSKISGLSSDTSKQNASQVQSHAAKNIFAPSQTDIKKLFESLNSSKTHPAILSLIAGLYDSELCKLDFEDMLEKSNQVFEAMNISIEQAKAIEEATKK